MWGSGRSSTAPRPASGSRAGCANDSAGVLIDVEGTRDDLDLLVRTLTESPPPLARVATVSVEAGLAPTGADAFRIVATRVHGPRTAPVSVDTAPCEACLAEMFDPADRRYRYPFINCTNCGPRYTIVRAVPYDRPATTMAGFAMCAACQARVRRPHRSSLPRGAQRLPRVRADPHLAERGRPGPWPRATTPWTPPP